MNKYKIAIIIPYFGRFPVYFNLFLKSCENNKNIDFFIFTDDQDEYNIPKNVKVTYIQFEELKQEIQKLFDFSIVLNNPYKLCDFRPAYGLIFKSYIKDYDFWGYCDVDLIFGNISKFITDDILEEYDKILQRGHLSLIKNNKHTNNLFMKKYRNNYLFKDIFKDMENRTFDEKFHSGGGGINGIFEDNNLLVCKLDSTIADINIKFNNFTVNSDGNDNKNSIFVYKDKKLIRKVEKNDEVVDREYLYIHLQKRTMILKNVEIKELDEFIIVPNKFLKYDKNIISCENIKKFNKRKLINFTYINIRYRNLKRKFNKLKMEMF